MMGTVRPVTLRMKNAATEYCCPSDRGDDGRYFFIFQPAHLIEAQLPSQNEIWHHREVIPLFSIGKLHFIEWRGQCHRCIDHGNRIFKRIRWRVSHVSSGAIDSTSMTKRRASTLHRCFLFLIDFQENPLRHQSDCFAPDFYGHRVDLSIDGCVFVTFCSTGNQKKICLPRGTDGRRIVINDVW